MPVEPITTTDARSGRRLYAWLVALGLASLVFYAVVPTLLGSHPKQTGQLASMALYLSVFPLYFSALYVIWRHGATLLSARRVTWLALGGAALFRLAVLAGPVPENPGLWRYLWEGRVLIAGLNTYAAPPSSAVYNPLRRQLAEAHDGLYELLSPQDKSVFVWDRRGAPWSADQGHFVSLCEIRSTYGPVASALFALPSLQPFDRVVALRVLMTLFDMGTCVLLLMMLRGLRHNPLWALAYCWSPLCLNSFAEGGHVESPMVFLTVLAVWLLLSGRATIGGLAFALALGVKISPLLILPLLCRHGGKKFALAFLLTAPLVLAPILVAGAGGWQGFVSMADYWQNNDSIYSLALFVVRRLNGAWDAVRITRIAMGLSVGCYALWRALRTEPASREGLLKDIVCVLAAGLLLSPLVLPWYATNLLAFLCFVPSPGLLLLTASVMMWYLNAVIPWWPRVPGWMRALESHHREPWRLLGYVPVYILIVAAWLRRRRHLTGAALSKHPSD